MEGQPFKQRCASRSANVDAIPVCAAANARRASRSGRRRHLGDALPQSRAVPDQRDAQTEFVMELGREPWTKSSATQLARARMAQGYVALQGGQSMQPSAQLLFRLGYSPQTVLIVALRSKISGASWR